METKQALKPGPYPLRMDCGRTPDMFVVVTNQGNHFATTYDPSAARLVVAAPDMLAALREALPKVESLYLNDAEIDKTTGSFQAKLNVQGSFDALEMIKAAIAKAEGF